MMISSQSEKEVGLRRMILEGNLWETVLFITAPLAIYAVFNFLYIFFDLVIVSTIGSTEVASVVFIDEIKSAILAIGAGIAAGGSVLIARHYGAGRLNEAKTFAAQSMIAATLLAVGIAILMIVFGQTMLRVLNAPSDVVASGLGYYRIQIATTAVMAINSVYFGIEKAKGNTRLILRLHVAAMTLKLGLSSLFVFELGLGTTHVAIATLISQTLLCIVAMRMLGRSNNALRLNVGHFKLDVGIVREILALSLPVIVGKFLFSMGKVIVNGMAAYYGTMAVAAFGVALKINQGANAIPHIFEESETTIISQNLGNNQTKRALKTYWISQTYAFCFGVAGMIVTILLLDRMILMFSSHADPGFAALVRTIYHWEKFSNLTSSSIALITGLFIGFKRTRMSFLMNLTRLFLLRIPLLWLFISLGVGPEALGYIMFFSNVGTLAVGVTFLLLFLSKQRNTSMNALLNVSR